MYRVGARKTTKKKGYHFFERYKTRRESEKSKNNYTKSVSEEADKKNQDKSHDKKFLCRLFKRETCVCEK